MFFSNHWNRKWIYHKTHEGSAGLEIENVSPGNNVSEMINECKQNTWEGENRLAYNQ